MKIEELFSLTHVTNTKDSKSHDQAHGKLNGLLIVSDFVKTGDTLDVKIRSEEQTYVLCNNLDVSLINSISDMEGGLRGQNSTAQSISYIFDELDAHIDFTISASKYKQANSHLNAIYLPLGQITLGESEIEITYEASGNGSGSTNNITVYSVQKESLPDHYLQYDETKDFDTTQHMVRSLVFHSSDHLVDENGVYESIEFQIDTDDGTLLSDLRGLLLATNIFSEIDGLPETKNVKLYSDDSAVPGTVRVKATGYDATKQSLVIVKEIIPAAVSTSTVNELEKMRKRVEKLERTNADLAKRYRHAGRTEKSEEMAQVEQQLKASNEQEKEQAS